jgi:hypothetical protein
MDRRQLVRSKRYEVRSRFGSKRRERARRLLGLALATFVLALAASSTGGGSGALASPPGGTTFTIDNLQGFDTCAAPSSSTMSTWWSSSNYYYVGIYMGGVNRACSQPNLTASWVSTVAGQGWSFLPTWVSYQAYYPTCNTHTYSGGYIDLNTSSAYNQGVNAAQASETAAINLGFAAGTIIYLDVEDYVNSTQCNASVNAYVNGWTFQLRHDSFKAGVYGSICSSAPSDWYGLTNRPNDVWLAGGSTDPQVWNLSCIPNADWVADHRIHQYLAGHNETWGGVQLNVDTNCAIAEIAQGSLVLGNEVDSPGTNESNGPTEDPQCF